MQCSSLYSTVRVFCSMYVPRRRALAAAPEHGPAPVALLPQPYAPALCQRLQYRLATGPRVGAAAEVAGARRRVHQDALDGRLQFRRRRGLAQVVEHQRSEEHTSELQSLMRNSYAVFCLKQKK